MSQEPIKPTIKQNISLLSSLAQTSTPAKSQTPAPLLRRPLPAAKPTQKPAAEPQQKNDAAQPFRPVFRPPVAVLEICDDGRDEGEFIRIRGESLTIGRANADVLIAHDSQISSTHARISRRLVQGSYHWFLTDLNSTNGTFIRVAKVTLADGQFILLGSHRYLFRAAQLPATLAGACGGPPVTKPAAGSKSLPLTWAASRQLWCACIPMEPNGPTVSIAMTWSWASQTTHASL